MMSSNNSTMTTHQYVYNRAQYVYIDAAMCDIIILQDIEKTAIILQLSLLTANAGHACFFEGGRRQKVFPAPVK